MNINYSALSNGMLLEMIELIRKAIAEGRATPDYHLQKEAIEVELTQRQLNPVYLDFSDLLLLDMHNLIRTAFEEKRASADYVVQKNEIEEELTRRKVSFAPITKKSHL